MARKKLQTITSSAITSGTLSDPELLTTLDAAISQRVAHRCHVVKISDYQNWQILTLINEHMTEHRISDGRYTTMSTEYDLVDAVNAELKRGYLR